MGDGALFYSVAISHFMVKQGGIYHVYGTRAGLGAADQV